jgi:hypothetical protein
VEKNVDAKNEIAKQRLSEIERQKDRKIKRYRRNRR